jgi:plasmid stabilization system protein ParE
VSGRLIIRPEAEADMAEQFEWYEARKTGLGYDFLAEIRSALRKIEDNPLRYVRVYRNARRALLRKFPFKVFYVFEEDKIEVIGVIHARRDPQRWLQRVP